MSTAVKTIKQSSDQKRAWQGHSLPWVPQGLGANLIREVTPERREGAQEGKTACRAVLISR